MRKLVFLIGLIVYSSFLWCQQIEEIEIEDSFPSFAKNTLSLDGGALYIEIAGAASGLLNYGRLIYENERIATYLRTGLGFYYLIYGQNSVFGIQAPLSADVIFGKKNKHLELNIGGRYVRGLNIHREDNFTKQNNIFPVLNIGYRYQKPGKSAFVKILIGTDGLNTGFGLGF